MNYTKLLATILGLLFAVSSMQAYALVNDGKLSPKQQLTFYKYQADSAEQQQNLPKLVSLYTKMVELCRNYSELEDKLPENLYQQGLWTYFSGDYQTSISALIELLEMQDLSKEKHLLPLQARANVQLGITYFFMDWWDEALAHYQKAYEMAVKLNDQQGISIIENNIGNIYQKKGDYQEAIKQYQLSLQLQEEEDKETACNTYYNMATCYRELGYFEESIPYFNQALDMSKEIGETEIYALSLVELAYYNALKKNLFYEAEQQIKEAENLANQAGYKQILKEIYRTKVDIEEAKGNYASALDYYKKFKLLSDSLFNERSVSKLHEYEIRYQTKEKELEILRQQAEIDRHQTIQYIYLVVLIASGIVFILLVLTIRLRNKRNRELKEINATKDKFFSIISHDLKNPAIAQRNALQILAKSRKDLSDDMLSQYCIELVKSADYQVELLYGLLDWARIQTGRISYTPIAFDLADALRSEIAMIKKMTAAKNIDLDIQICDNAIATGDRNMFIAIVRNLLNNAVKFTGEGGRVLLEVTSSANGFTISISDNGVGMSKEDLNNLFRLDSSHSKPGTTGEQGSGLGLMVCKEMVEKHGSSLHVESEIGEGSQFRFEMKA
jgi:Signal transduction histidine kinase